MDEQRRTDDELFEKLGRNKKKRRRRTIWAVIITVLAVVLVLTAAVLILQRQVRSRFASEGDEVLSYTAAVGSIHTTVTGSGQLADVDVEEITVPNGVEIEEVAVETNDTVREGDVLARLDMTSVLSAMSKCQEELDSLDERLAEASGDEVDDIVEAGVSGRVKVIFAAEGDSVADCMVKNGALAILSIDGYMAVDIESAALSVGDTVTVDPDDGWLYTGTVEMIVGGAATILLTDNGPAPDAEAAILTEDGETELGRGTLYIHNPLRVTGFAGSVESVLISENEAVDAGDDLFSLADTSYSANYDAILRERGEKESEMLELLSLYEDGALRAPFSGSIRSVDYTEEDETAVQAGMYAAAQSTDPLLILTLSRDEEMEVVIGVDETDILTLEPGQNAVVTIRSLDDTEFAGTVTEVNTTADSGTAQFSARILLDKDPRMLPGMTATADVEIEGADNVILVPAEAVHRTSAVSYVYTSYDEETKEYGGRKDVVTGLSGRDYIEIVSGLSEGETVYYTEAQTFSFSFGSGGFGPGRFGSGEMGG